MKKVKEPRIPKVKIYEVTVGETVRLIRSTSKSKAAHHAVNVSVSTVTADRVVELIGQKVEIEDATVITEVPA